LLAQHNNKPTMRIVTGDEVGLVKVVSFPSTFAKHAQPLPSKKPKYTSTAVIEKSAKTAAATQPVIHPLIAEMDKNQQVQMIIFTRKTTTTTTKKDKEEGKCIVVGCRNGIVKVLDLDSGRLVREFRAFVPRVGEDGNVVLDKDRKEEEFVGIFEQDGVFTTCTSFGTFTHHRPIDPSNRHGTLLHYKIDLKMEGLKRMRVFPGSADHFATGGDERDLSVWKFEFKDVEGGAAGEEEGEDGSQPWGGIEVTSVWKAKNVKNDFLDLRVPIHITDLAFINPEGDAPTKIVTISKFRHYRVYDLNRDGKRPALSVEIGEHPLRCLHLMKDGKEAIVADMMGNVTHLETDTGKRLGGYRGVSGTVTQVTDIPKLKQVAVISIDRFLRIFESYGQRRLIKKVYLKQRLTCMAVDETYEGDAPRVEPASNGADEETYEPMGMEAIEEAPNNKAGKKRKAVVEKKNVVARGKAGSVEKGKSGTTKLADDDDEDEEEEEAPQLKTKGKGDKKGKQKASTKVEESIEEEIEEPVKKKAKVVKDSTATKPKVSAKVEEPGEEEAEEPVTKKVKAAKVPAVVKPAGKKFKKRAGSRDPSAGWTKTKLT
ncbi:WD repeat-containing protein 74, partial [Blyttiomyces sp. JEL0837]